MATYEARIVTVTIERNWQEVYDFMAEPLNMPLWATGLSNSMRRDGEEYFAEGGPIGLIRVKFAPRNAFGVVDHRVTLESGQTFDNALRVVPNGSGAEVMFTLLKTDGMDEAAFKRDADHVLNDLNRLKAIVESK